MPERQLGEVPEAAVDSAWVAVKRASLTHPETRQVLEAAMDPILGDQRLVPASAVADAVRAERERLKQDLRIFGRRPSASLSEIKAVSIAIDFIESFSPADGNTEEEG